MGHTTCFTDSSEIFYQIQSKQLEKKKITDTESVLDDSLLDRRKLGQIKHMWLPSRITVSCIM